MPVLLLHSAVDHVVEPENSRVLLAEIGSDDVTEIVLHRSFHVAMPGTRGDGPGRRREAVIGTGLSGTVYWVQLRNGDRDHLEDAHPAQYGFALPPMSAQDGGDALKVRAFEQGSRQSLEGARAVAVGRGQFDLADARRPDDPAREEPPVAQHVEDVVG